MNDAKPVPGAPAAPVSTTGPLFIVFNLGSGAVAGAAAAAGAGAGEQARATIQQACDAAGRSFQLMRIDQPDQLPARAREAVQLAQQSGGVVVAAGGDGTLNAVAQATLGSGCAFGVLPQGTFNYFGRVNGIPQDTHAAATALLGARMTPVQVGEVNGRIFLVNASLGLYPQLLEDREAWKHQFGRSRFVAFLSGLSTLVRARGQLRLEMEVAGQTASLRTPTLFVGNNHLQLSRVGLEENIAGAVNRGELAGIVLKPTGTLALFGLLARGLLGRLGDADTVDSFSFRRLTVLPRGAKRVKVATDGEIAWMKTPLVFQVADTPLQLLVPAPADRADVA